MKKIAALFKNKMFLRTSGAILAVILIASAYVIFESLTGRVFIDNSITQSPIITVSPSMSGKVQEIDVKEGQSVQTGDTLAVVGSETLRADTDGLVISAPDLTGSTVTPATALVQMIRPVNLRLAGSIDEIKV